MNEVADLIMKHAPDWRRVINELQRASVGGTLNLGTLIRTDASYDNLFKALKDSDKDSCWYFADALYAIGSRKAIDSLKKSLFYTDLGFTVARILNRFSETKKKKYKISQRVIDDILLIEQREREREELWRRIKDDDNSSPMRYGGPWDSGCSQMNCD